MDKTTSGWLNGLIGVVIFSGSLPATRIAVTDFDPVFLTVARASIAGILALGLLLLFQQKRPARNDMTSLFIVSLGVVVGFPLLTALAPSRDIGAFHRVRRALAARNRGLRRVAGWRTSPPRLLAVFLPGQCSRGRFFTVELAFSRSWGFACRRSPDAGRDHRLRAGLCRGRRSVA